MILAAKKRHIDLGIIINDRNWTYSRKHDISWFIELGAVFLSFFIFGCRRKKWNYFVQYRCVCVCLFVCVYIWRIEIEKSIHKYPKIEPEFVATYFSTVEKRENFYCGVFIFEKSTHTHIQNVALEAKKTKKIAIIINHIWAEFYSACFVHFPSLFYSFCLFMSAPWFQF